MSSDQTWVEALKISPESLSSWSLQVPSGTPLLVWCITNGHVQPEQYLAWACDHFGLPVLDSRFFTAAFNKENLQALRDQSLWSAWCFPIGEWDGVTFVACTEPLNEMPEGQYAFILADPNVMLAAWSDESKEKTVIEAPLGIAAEPQTFVLNLGDDVMGSHDHNKPVPPATPEKKQDEVTGITLSVVHVPEHTKPATPTSPMASVKPAAPPTKGTPPPPPPTPTKSTAKPADMAINFGRLHEMYESVLVMRCGDGSAQPYKWDTHLPIVEGDSKYNVNLSYPGFLRIVAKTMQPYHGYVIDSPAHREFFENLRVNGLPACVSAVPLKSGEKLWGMLIAWGGDAAKPQDALNEALAVGEKIAHGLGLTKSKSA